MNCDGNIREPCLWKIRARLKLLHGADVENHRVGHCRIKVVGSARQAAIPAPILGSKAKHHRPACLSRVESVGATALGIVHHEVLQGLIQPVRQRVVVALKSNLLVHQLKRAEKIVRKQVSLPHKGRSCVHRPGGKSGLANRVYGQGSRGCPASESRVEGGHSGWDGAVVVVQACRPNKLLNQLPIQCARSRLVGAACAVVLAKVGIQHFRNRVPGSALQHGHVALRSVRTHKAQIPKRPTGSVGRGVAGHEALRLVESEVSNQAAVVVRRQVVGAHAVAHKIIGYTHGIEHK
mmetsp:Transcript_43186/g.80926  ORF Transcript_43186/g.80926 Transcript_43186/m.80926 type:complete len:293 (+) Transcript_43186:3052-3930(+)